MEEGKTAAIKIHIGKLSDDGSVSCDYRGDSKIGAENGDHHTTIYERDPAPTDLVEWVIEHGPEINADFVKFDEMLKHLGLEPSKLLSISSALGGPAGFQLRLGVWDN